MTRLNNWRGSKMEKLMSLKEAAEVLKCSVRTVRRLLSEGELEGCHVRGSVRVTYRCLEKYIRDQISKYQLDNGLYENGGTDRDKP